MIKEFILEKGEFIPLCSLLKMLSLCESGGIAKLVISEGEVKVNGTVELRKRCKIYANTTVEFDSYKIIVKEKP